MNNNYLNIYNNLIKLTRNKFLYINLIETESFSDRIIFLLIHLSFFLKIYKSDESKKTMQEIHDFIFKQIELSIREIGYGDVSINKNMKKYVNFFYDIISKVDNWDNVDFNEKSHILNKIINKPKNISFFVNYFDKLCLFYKNNTLNYFKSDIEEFKI
tara:strand:- start:1720 stop:2193 length:474 start_codon:yes stop_codon:yes gene_type:complete